MKLLPLLLLSGCFSPPFVTNYFCDTNFGVWNVEQASPQCLFYDRVIRDAEVQYLNLTGERWNTLQVVVWVHEDFPTIRCQGKLELSGNAGCAYPTGGGVFWVETTLGAGELLHEMLHVYQMQHGMSESETSHHPLWVERGWWDAANRTQSYWDAWYPNLTPWEYTPDLRR